MLDGLPYINAIVVYKKMRQNYYITTVLKVKAEASQKREI